MGSDLESSKRTKVGVGSCIVHDGTIRCDLLSLPQLTHDCQPVFSSLRCTFGRDSRCNASATV